MPVRETNGIGVAVCAAPADPSSATVPGSAHRPWNSSSASSELSPADDQNWLRVTSRVPPAANCKQVKGHGPQILHELGMVGSKLATDHMAQMLQRLQQRQRRFMM